jgi:holo-[acyl-carrier protein] synthase
MIKGVGIDLVQISRLDEKLKRNPDLRFQIFTRDEIQYCEAQKNAAQHYAGFFAAKESVLKALGVGLQQSYDIHQIEVRHNEAGRPEVFLGLHFEILLDHERETHFHLSISHEGEYAIAQTVMEVL